MHFRRERRNGVVVSLQETLEAGKEDSALTLSDVLQDGFCMEDACERQDEARRLRRLIEGLPARERKLILLRYGLAGQPDQQKLCLKARDPRTGSVAQRLASRITGRIKGAACGRRTYPLLQWDRGWYTEFVKLKSGKVQNEMKIRKANAKK